MNHNAFNTVSTYCKYQFHIETFVYWDIRCDLHMYLATVQSFNPINHLRTLVTTCRVTSPVSILCCVLSWKVEKFHRCGIKDRPF